MVSKRNIMLHWSNPIVMDISKKLDKLMSNGLNVIVEKSVFQTNVLVTAKVITENTKDTIRNARTLSINKIKESVKIIYNIIKR